MRAVRSARARLLGSLSLSLTLAAAAPACGRKAGGGGGAGHGKGGVLAASDQTSFLTNFAPLALVDQDGRPFRGDSLRGKVVLFNFIFTSCPNVCPVQTQALADVQRALPAPVRDRVQFVSVSIDPEHDTPAVLRSFASRVKVDFARWTFVTGGTADIDRLAEGLRLFAQNRERRPENHGTTLWLMDAGGRLMQRYAGDPPEVPRLVRELDTLVKLTN
jgi:protein SCO1/2